MFVLHQALSPMRLGHGHYTDHVLVLDAVILERAPCQEGIVERLPLAERAAFPDARLGVTDMW